MNTVTYDNQIASADEFKSLRMDDFCRDSLRKRSWVYMAWLILALALSGMVYTFYQDSPSTSMIPLQIVYYLILGVHLIFRFKAGGRANILAPDVVFIFFYTCFHLGYVTLYSLNIMPYSDDVFFYARSIPKALFIINLGLISFLLGYEIISRKTGMPIQSKLTTIPRFSWCALGIILMTASILMHFLGLATLGLHNIQRYGYAAISGAYRYSSYFTVLMLAKSTMLMVLGLVIYLISSSLRYRKLFKSKIALTLVIMYIVIVILEGERGTVLKLCLPMFMIRHYFIKRIRIRYLLIFFIIGIFIFVGLGVVRKTVFKPLKMWDEYKYQEEAGMTSWYNAFAEMGQSFLVVVITCNDVPNIEPYWKGASWGSAAIHMVPFLQGIAMRRGLIRWEPSEWVTTTYYGPERAGRGFTVAAEGYLNFGYVGTFIELLFLGLFIRWLTVRFSSNPSAMWALIMFGCLGPLIMVIRNHLNLLTQPCVIVIGVAILANTFLGQEQNVENMNPESSSDFVLSYS